MGHLGHLNINKSTQHQILDESISIVTFASVLNTFNTTHLYDIHNFEVQFI